MNFKGSIEHELTEVEEQSQGTSGGWQEPAEPPFITYICKQVRIYPTGWELNDVELKVGDHISFDVGQDDNNYNGEGTGTVDVILGIDRGDIVIELVDGTVTYTGMTPSQSQKGCM